MVVRTVYKVLNTGLRSYPRSGSYDCPRGAGGANFGNAALGGNREWAVLPSEVTVIDRCPTCGQVLTPCSVPHAPSVTCDFPMIPVAGGGFLYCNEPRGHAGDHAYTSQQYFV